MKYRIFDTHLGCNVPLAALPRWHGPAPDIEVNFHPRLAVDTDAFKWIYSWQNSRHETTIVCARRGDDYLLRFPGVAVFHVLPRDAIINAYPDGKSQRLPAVRLLLDQVIPRMLFHRGRAVLHASAVTLPGGRAIAFLGDTGRGKSTIAASFHQSGATLLSDDCLLIQQSNGSNVGIPAYAGLRLWPDSFAALGFDVVPAVARLPDDGKFRMVVNRSEHERAPPRLSALFVLGDPQAAPVDERVVWDKVVGANAMMLLVEAAFVLDLVSVDTVSRNFELLGRIARHNTSVYRLNYPRKHAFLPAVRTAVEQLLGKHDDTWPDDATPG